MYSVSKSFVSVAVGLAAEEGLLSLDDKLIKYFSDYTDGKDDALLSEMTIREALTMETCMTERENWFTSKVKKHLDNIVEYAYN